MTTTQNGGSVDQLYLNAEQLSEDFSLFPRKEPAHVVKGLLTEREILRAGIVISEVLQPRTARD